MNRYYVITYKNDETADCTTIGWLKMLTNLRRIKNIKVYEFGILESKQDSKLVETINSKKELRAYVKRYEDENRKI